MSFYDFLMRLIWLISLYPVVSAGTSIYLDVLL